MTAYTQLKTTLTILTIITIYLNFLSIAKDSPVSTVLSWHHYLTLLYHATLVFEMAFGILATLKKTLIHCRCVLLAKQQFGFAKSCSFRFSFKKL